jgi:serine/threonine protein kinase/WD40 repeat protein
MSRWGDSGGRSEGSGTRTIPDDGSTLREDRAEPAADVGLNLRAFSRDDFIIEREVARGGLGRVLRARDPRLNRIVAIKELLRSDADTRARFLREIRAAARLQHPSIMPLYEAGCWPDGEPFYVMKLVVGRSLATAIAEGTTLNERLRLLANVTAVTEAMAYAHAEGVLHRDLKPGNILLGEFGETVIIDWGLAKNVAPEPDEPAAPAREGRAAPGDTSAGDVLGTPAYMSPEQALGRTADARSDVYAVGAILYHLLTGRPPHMAPTTEQVLLSVVDSEPPDVAALVPEVPREMAAIVRRAISKRPTDRYQTMGALADDLIRFRERKLVAAYSYSMPRRVAHRVRKYVPWISLAALATLVAVGVTSYRKLWHERASAQARAEQALLDDARQSLASDPMTTLAKLTSLPRDSTRWSAARMIAARAQEGAPRIITAIPGSQPTFSTDGKLAVRLFGNDTRIELLDLESGEVRPISAGTAPRTVQVVVTPTRIFAGSIDGTVLAFDPTTGGNHVLAQGPSRLGVRSLVASEDGSVGAGVIGDAVHVWYPGDARWLRIPVEPRALAIAVAISPNGRLLAWTNSGTQITVRDLEDSTDASLDAIQQGSILALEFSPTGQRLLFRGSMSTGYFSLARNGHWSKTERSICSAATFVGVDTFACAIPASSNLDLEGPRGPRQISLPEPGIHRLRVSSDGATLAAFGDNRMWLIDLHAAATAPRAFTAPGPITDVAMDANAAVHARLMDGTIYTWRLQASTALGDGAFTPIWRLGYARTGELVGAGSDEQFVFTGQRPQATPYEASRRFVMGPVALSQNADWIAKVGAEAHGDTWEMHGRVFNVRSTQGQTFSHEIHSITDVAVSNDGEWIAIAGSGEGRRVGIDLVQPRDNKRQHLDGAQPWAVAFDGDSQRLATATQSDVSVWNLSALRAPMKTVSIGFGSPPRLVFSPQGALAVARTEGVELLKRGSDEVAHVTGPIGADAGVIPQVKDVAFSHDGQTLAIAIGHIVRLVDVTTGESRILKDGPERALAVTFSADDAKIVASDQNGRVHVWQDSLPRTAAGFFAWLQSVVPGAGRQR